MVNVGSFTIWQYWENVPGKTKPPYLDVCETTIRRFSGDMPVRVVDSSTVGALIGTLPPMWDEMSVVQRSDYARVRLVLKYGGVWIDSDTIALRPLENLVRPIEDGATFVGWGHDGDNNLFAGVPDAPILALWAARQDEILSGALRPSDLSWSALGSEILTQLVTEEDWHRLDERKISPIGWQDFRLFLSRTYPSERVLRHDPIVVALYNAQLSEPLSGISADRLFNSNMLLGRLLRRGLGFRERRISGALQLLAPVGAACRRVGLRHRVRSRNAAVRRDRSKR
jgi:hypothetical protein